MDTPPPSDAAKDEAVRREKFTWTAATAADPPESGGSWARLRGELDVHDLDALGTLLRAAAQSDCPIFVDLSGVTFLDVGCATELALSHLRSPDLLVMCGPSWQAAASFTACGFAGRIEFRARVADADGTGAC